MVFKLKWIYVGALAAFLLVLLVLLTGCPDNGGGLIGEDGTITVSLTGAGDHNGGGFMFGVFNQGVTNVFSATSLGGSDVITIIDGTAQGVALDEDTYTDQVVFSGGMSYVVGALIDADSDDVPSPGDYISDPLKGVVVDGDMIVEFIYPTDFRTLEDGTITVRVTGADAHDGENFLPAVFTAGADILNDDPIGYNLAEIASGMAQGVILDPDNLPTPLTFAGGTAYDVVGLIDLDGNTYASTGDYFSYELGVIVDGNTIMEFVYPTDFVLITP
jgi:hypothetical protein